MGWLRATGNGDKDSSNGRGRSLGHGGSLAEPVVQVDVTNHENCEPTIKDNVLDKLRENSNCVSGGGCFNADRVSVQNSRFSYHRPFKGWSTSRRDTCTS